MKRYHVVREVFARDKWEERPLPFHERVFRFRRDAEAVANYLHATRTSGLVRYLIVRRPLK